MIEEFYKYYKGEKENPFSDKDQNKALFWCYEKGFEHKWNSNKSQFGNVENKEEAFKDYMYQVFENWVDKQGDSTLFQYLCGLYFNG